MDVDTEPTTGHGTTVNGDPAYCRKLVDAVTDCSACLDEQWAITCLEFDKTEMEIAGRVLSLVNQNCEKGQTKDTLVVCPLYSLFV